MIRVHVEAERSTSSAAEENNKERGDKVVELDQFKTLLNAYEEPLAEMRDSL